MTEDYPQMWPTEKQRRSWTEISLIHLEQLRTEAFSEDLSAEVPIRLLLVVTKASKLLLKAINEDKEKATAAKEIRRDAAVFWGKICIKGSTKWAFISRKDVFTLHLIAFGNRLVCFECDKSKVHPIKSKYFGLISHIHLVKRPKKVLGNRRSNLEDDEANLVFGTFIPG